MVTVQCSSYCIPGFCITFLVCHVSKNGNGSWTVYINRILTFVKLVYPVACGVNERVFFFYTHDSKYMRAPKNIKYFPVYYSGIQKVVAQLFLSFQMKRTANLDTIDTFIPVSLVLQFFSIANKCLPILQILFLNC